MSQQQTRPFQADDKPVPPCEKGIHTSTSHRTRDVLKIVNTGCVKHLVTKFAINNPPCVSIRECKTELSTG
jgi:hypothetical protein